MYMMASGADLEFPLKQLSINRNLKFYFNNKSIIIMKIMETGYNRRQDDR
jgi:hypothetical protein